MNTKITLELLQYTIITLPQHKANRKSTLSF